MGAYYRAMRARLGPRQAIVATAHKIARVVYHLLKTGEPYREEGAAEYDRKRRERELKHLTQRASAKWHLQIFYIARLTSLSTPNWAAPTITFVKKEAYSTGKNFICIPKGMNQLFASSRALQTC